MGASPKQVQLQLKRHVIQTKVCNSGSIQTTQRTSRYSYRQLQWRDAGHNWLVAPRAQNRRVCFTAVHCATDHIKGAVESVTASETSSEWVADKTVLLVSIKEAISAHASIANNPIELTASQPQWRLEASRHLPLRANSWSDLPRTGIHCVQLPHIATNRVPVHPVASASFKPWPSITGYNIIIRAATVLSNVERSALNSQEMCVAIASTSGSERLILTEWGCWNWFLECHLGAVLKRGLWDVNKTGRCV